MTQPTIKEKIEQAIQDNGQYIIDDLVRAIVKIITQEMTGMRRSHYFLQGKVCSEDNNVEDSCEEFGRGYETRIIEEKQKAQEILKALE